MGGRGLFTAAFIYTGACPPKKPCITVRVKPYAPWHHAHVVPRSSDHSRPRRGALGGSFVLRRQPLRLVPRPPNSSLSRQLTQTPQLPPGLAAGSPSALAWTGGPASAPASLHARVALPAPLPAPLPTPRPPSSELGATIRGRADCDARRSLLSKSPGAAWPPRASALHCMV